MLSNADEAVMNIGRQTCKSRLNLWKLRNNRNQYLNDFRCVLF